MFEQSNLGNIIREKALEIEQNMSIGVSNVNKKIDMNLIEALKQRRKDSERQVRGKDLDLVREHAISTIQLQILNQ